MRRPLALQLYRIISQLLAPFSGWILRQRAQRGKEDPERLSERFGRTGHSRPDGALLWLHGASVGESRIILDLVRRLQDKPGLHFLVTTGTVTSAQMLETELPEPGIHQYAPIDRPACVRRFLDHWQPDAAVFVESELWPNLIAEIRQHDIPAALVNARMNARSLENWAKQPKSARYLLKAFTWIGAADEQTAAGLTGILDRDILPIGNLKLELEPSSPNEAELCQIKAQIGDRPVWLAASTHEGEDEIILAAHKRVLEQQQDTLLILAPRHPERAGNIAELAKRADLILTRRSAGQVPDNQTAVWLADSLGEMALWYRSSDIALIGGSLVEGIGGHNPIEATQADCPVITGPYTASFGDIFAAYRIHGGTQIVRTDKEIAQAVLLPIADLNTHAEAALAALRGTAMQDTLAAIEGLLARGRT